MKRNLATAIRSIRAGLTQTQFATFLGVRQASVSGWESGAVIPGVAILVRLLRLAQREEEIKPIVTALAALGVSLGDLASLSEPAAAA
jgi:DNA-binding transcriptional regulator YiaG